MEPARRTSFYFGLFLLLFGGGELPSGPLALLIVPEIVWEGFIAVYCTWKGFRPSPVLAELRPSAQPA